MPLQAMGRQIGDAANRMVLQAALMMVAMMALFLGFCSGLLALWLALLPRIGPVQASLVLGAMLVALAFVLMLVAMILQKRRKTVPPPEPVATDLSHQVNSLMPLLLGIMALGFTAGRTGK